VVTNYGLRDDSGKINLNAATNANGRELIRSLLELAGGVDRDEAEQIADHLADWIDEDHVVREHGNESWGGDGSGREHYNGRMGAVDELLLVDGVSKQLYGMIKDHLTVHGDRVAINLNTADTIVLASLAGLSRTADHADCMAIAQKIVARREDDERRREETMDTHRTRDRLPAGDCTITSVLWYCCGTAIG